MSAARSEPIYATDGLFMRARAHALDVEGKLVSDDMIRKTHSELEAMLDGAGKEWARLRANPQVLLEHDVWPHSSLDYRTPNEFKRDCKIRDART